MTVFLTSCINLSTTRIIKCVCNCDSNSNYYNNNNSDNTHNNNHTTTTKLCLSRTHFLEVVTDLKLALLGGNIRLDFSVSVIDDGQEHVEQHKEYEEHVGDEEDRSKHAVRVLDLVEVKVAQDDSEQREAEMAKGAIQQIYRVRNYLF